MRYKCTAETPSGLLGGQTTDNILKVADFVRFTLTNYAGSTIHIETEKPLDE